MDSQGYVPMSLIAGFNKVQQLTKDLRLIIEVSFSGFPCFYLWEFLKRLNV